MLHISSFGARRATALIHFQQSNLPSRNTRTTFTDLLDSNAPSRTSNLDICITNYTISYINFTALHGKLQKPVHQLTDLQYKMHEVLYQMQTCRTNCTDSYSNLKTCTTNCTNYYIKCRLAAQTAQTRTSASTQLFKITTESLCTTTAVATAEMLAKGNRQSISVVHFHHHHHHHLHHNRHCPSHALSANPPEPSPTRRLSLQRTKKYDGHPSPPVPAATLN